MLNRPQRGSSSTSSQEQSLVVKTRHQETRKRHHHEVSSLEGSDDSDNDAPTHKSPRVNSHHSCVQSSTTPVYRDDHKVSIQDEEEMNRNLKALQWEPDGNNIGKDGIDDGEDGFKELAQELNKEGLNEPVQQTLVNILETVWQNPQSYKKMQDKMKIYARPENCSSLVVKKKCNKEIWQAHLTSRDRAKDLRFQKIQTAVLKGTIAITQVTSDLVKLKSNRELTAKGIRKSVIPVIKTCTEAMTFLGYANQEADSIRRTNIAMSLPKDSSKGCANTFGVAFW